MAKPADMGGLFARTVLAAVQSLIDWLVKDSGIPTEKRVDFDA